jgi:hypothetical protein
MNPFQNFTRRFESIRPLLMPSLNRSFEAYSTSGAFFAWSSLSLLRRRQTTLAFTLRSIEEGVYGQN